MSRVSKLPRLMNSQICRVLRISKCQIFGGSKFLPRWYRVRTVTCYEVCSSMESAAEATEPLIMLCPICNQELVYPSVSELMNTFREHAAIELTAAHMNVASLFAVIDLTNLETTESPQAKDPIEINCLPVVHVPIADALCTDGGITLLQLIR
eukprot:g48915.t1